LFGNLLLLVCCENVQAEVVCLLNLHGKREI
jgi:hypothetical protein